MSDVTAQPNDLTLAEFLIWEERQETKHEFVAGNIVAFAGGALRHAGIAIDLLVSLDRTLQGTPCRAFGSDVMVETATSARYPDLVVTCDERDTRDLSQRAVRYPKLIVEVLSESTAAIDRGEKLDEYRTLATLEEYVLVDSRRRWFTSYRRVDDTWVASLPATFGTVSFESIGAKVDLDALYERAGFSSSDLL